MRKQEAVIREGNRITIKGGDVIINYRMFIMVPMNLFFYYLFFFGRKDKPEINFFGFLFFTWWFYFVQYKDWLQSKKVTIDISEYLILIKRWLQTVKIERNYAERVVLERAGAGINGITTIYRIGILVRKPSYLKVKTVLVIAAGRDKDGCKIGEQLAAFLGIPFEDRLEVYGDYLS